MTLRTDEEWEEVVEIFIAVHGWEWSYEVRNEYFLDRHGIRIGGIPWTESVTGNNDLFWKCFHRIKGRRIENE